MLTIIAEAPDYALCVVETLDHQAVRAGAMC
jgi:hypothetical protein